MAVARSLKSSIAIVVAVLPTFRASPMYGNTPLPTWAANASGTWHDAENWLPIGVPNSSLSPVQFGGEIIPITDPQTVFLNQPATVHSVTFNTAANLAVAGTATLTIASTSTSTIAASQGSHEFQVRVALGATTDVDASAGAEIRFNNELTFNGNDLNITGDGIVIINNRVNSGGGAINNLGNLGGAGANAFSGGLNSPGTLHVSIGGTSPSEFDSFDLSGDVTLSGPIHISLVNGFTPAVGDTFDVVSGASLTGNGASLTGDWIGFSTSIVGHEPTAAGRDLLTLLITEPARISSWQAQYGQSENNGQSLRLTFVGGLAYSLPEPSTQMIFAVAGLIFSGRRRLG